MPKVLMIPQATDERMTEVECELDWQSLGKLVEGYIERVHIRPAQYQFVNGEDLTIHGEHIMIVNEEGQYKKDFALNPRASILYGVREHGGIVVGPALLLCERMTGDGPDFCSYEKG